MPRTGCAKRRLVPVSGQWIDLTGAARDVGRDQGSSGFCCHAAYPGRMGRGLPRDFGGRCRNCWLCAANSAAGTPAGGKADPAISGAPLKNGLEPLKFLPRMVKWQRWNPSDKPVYLLCASAYAAGDYAKMGLFRGKAYKWGYFPAALPMIRKHCSRKKSRAVYSGRGRFLAWKHPDDAIRLAARLRMQAIRFSAYSGKRDIGTEAAWNDRTICFGISGLPSGQSVTGAGAPGNGTQRNISVYFGSARRLGRCVERGHEQRLRSRCQ